MNLRDPVTGRYISKVQYEKMYPLLASVQRALYRESMNKFDKDFTPPKIEQDRNMLIGCGQPQIPIGNGTVLDIDTGFELWKHNGDPWHQVPRSKKKQAQMMANMLRGLDEDIDKDLDKIVADANLS